MAEDSGTVVLARKLDIIIKFLALNAVKDKSVAEQVDILNRIGLKPKEIADVLGKSENQVYVTMSKLKKIRSQGELDLRVESTGSQGEPNE